MAIEVTDTVIKIGTVQVLKAQEAVIAAVTPTVAAVAPAGGTGAAAGGWDTAGNRDTAITTINQIKTLAEANKVAINLVIAMLKTHGIIASA